MLVNGSSLTSDTLCVNDTALHALVAEGGDGNVTFYVSSLDAAGNRDATPASTSWTLDTHPPTTLLAAEGAGTVLASLPAPVMNATAVRVRVTANEPTLRFLGTLNGTEMGAFDGPLVDFSSLPDGLHTFGMRAVDTADNTDPVGALTLIITDTQPPATKVVVLPPPLVNISTVTFTVEATGELYTESVLGFFVTVELAPGGGSPLFPPLLASPPNVSTAVAVAAVEGLTSGLFVITARAADRFGHVDERGVRVNVTVDLLPPLSQFDPAFVQEPFQNVSTVAMRVVCVDALSLVTLIVQRDDGNATITSPLLQSGDIFPLAFTDVVDGEHVFDVSCVDSAGNTQQAELRNVTVTVDTVAPVLSLGAAVPANTNDLQAVNICVLDATVSKLALSVDGVHVSSAVVDVSGSRLCVDMRVVTPAAFPSGLTDGNHTVVVSAVDAALNDAVDVHAWFVLDTVAPGHDPLVFAVPASPTACFDVAETLVCNGTDVAFDAVCDSATSPVARAPCTLEWELEAVVASTCSDNSSTSTVATSPSRLLSYHAAIATAQQLRARVPMARALLVNETAGGAGIVPLFLSGDGEFLLHTFAKDAAGNNQTAAVARWWVDTSPPAPPFMQQKPDSVILSTTAQFTFRLDGDNSPGRLRFSYSVTSDSDPPGTVAVSQFTDAVVVPNLKPRALTAVVSRSSLVSGRSYTMTVFSVDQAGWRSATPAVTTWRVAAAVPNVVLGVRPAVVSGLVKPMFQLIAMWQASQGSGPAIEASFEVLLVDDPRLNTWHAPCNETDAPRDCPVVCRNGAGCNYTLSLSTPKTYTLQIRAVLFGTKGTDITSVTWEYKRCADDEFAVLTDGDAITCLPCPSGGDCVPKTPTQRTSGIVLKSEIVAQPGYWASQNSTSFVPCPLPSACLPGENGTRSTCARGYGHVACSVCADGYFEQFGVCVKCPASQGQSVGVLLGFVIMLSGIAFLVFLVRHLLPVDVIKLGVSLVQVLASASASYK